jgi:hypothetical protein
MQNGPNSKKSVMEKIESGAATALYRVDSDGVLRARWSGLVLPGTAADLSARLLRAAADGGAHAVLGDLQQALLALPPVTADYYRWVPPELRSFPIGFVISAEQQPIYQHLPRAAAQARTVRRAVRSLADGEIWVHEHVKAYSANRLWWARRRA